MNSKKINTQGDYFIMGNYKKQLTKLLNGPIGTPGQLQCDVHPSFLVQCPAVRLQRDTRAGRFWDDGYILWESNKDFTLSLEIHYTLKPPSEIKLHFQTIFGNTPSNLLLKSNCTFKPSLEIHPQTSFWNQTALSNHLWKSNHTFKPFQKSNHAFTRP